MKAVTISVMSLLILICSACGYNAVSSIKWRTSKIEEPDLNSNPDITIRTELSCYLQGTKKLNILIINNSNDVLDYGAPYILERNDDDEWHSANMDNIAWITIAYLIRPGETHTHEINFDVLESLPPDGEYRIIKKIGGNMYCAVFSIAAAG